MSSKTPADSQGTTSTNSSGHCVNAGIDSAFRNDPAHRGSLSSSELDSIHQTTSFKQAVQLEQEDNHELAAKIKQNSRTKESTK